MKILLTGASSFTGAWFAHGLASAGHSVTATLQKEKTTYTGIRGKRIEWIRNAGIELVESCSFGSQDFMRLLKHNFDILCHHAANVENYKSQDFDVIAALRCNTLNIRAVIETAKSCGLRGIVLTGSVFEQNEGAGNAPLRAFSPYGLSKGLTWQVFAYWATIIGIPLHKFVIPNPFGPYEEPRFCSYLIQKWMKGEVAQINTPNYVRDNIHVSLLVAAYTDFVARCLSSSEWKKINPTGYVETQGAFAKRFAQEMETRLGISANLAFATQTDFSEPLSRINTDLIELPWDESSSWDDLANYYRDTYPRQQ